MRALIGRLALFLGVPAIALGMGIVAAVPAMASGQGPMCQTFDHNYCIRIDSITNGTQIKEGGAPGRTIAWSGCNSEGCEGLLFIVASQTGQAIKRTDNGAIVVGGELDNGTVWIRHNATGILYENRRNRGWLITGQNISGSNILSCARPCTVIGQAEQQWNGPR